MAAASAPLYLLDTNIFIHAVRGRDTWARVKAACDPLMAEPRPVYSVVTEAELLSFAEQRSWDAARRRQATFLLGYFDRVGIEDQQVLDAYVLLDTYSRRHPEGGIKMGKNDLWIAATACVLQAALITTDRDFEHLHGTHLTRVFVP